MEFQFIDGRAAGMLAMDFVIIFVVLLSIRALFGFISGVNATSELASKDNFAFGISLTGATAGVAIMLSGVATGGIARSFGEEAALMVVFAVVGLVLMWFTRLIFDRVTLPGISVRDEIDRGNTATAIVDAGNVVATAIMIRAIIVWSDDVLTTGLIAVFIGYIASQIILTLTAFYRVQLFSRRNKGAQFQEAIRDGNVALALRFAGFQAGIAFGVTAASGLAVYDTISNPVLQGLAWSIASLVLSAVLIGLSMIAERFVLAGIDVSEEVDQQRNVGVGLVEVSVYISIGLLLNGLLG
jgi:uncharacterized membrane protein YjfL (UPF0719 family)